MSKDSMHKADSTSNDCIFCKIVAEQIPSTRVYEDDDIIIFKDIAPVAEVHLIGIPREHHAGLGALFSANTPLAGRYVKKLTEIACKESGNGQYKLLFNTGESVGQTVFHVHGHILAGEGAKNAHV